MTDEQLARETERHTCRTCGETRPLTPVGENRVGRTVWECPDGHRQAGPEPINHPHRPND